MMAGPDLALIWPALIWPGGCTGTRQNTEHVKVATHQLRQLHLTHARQEALKMASTGVITGNAELDKKIAEGAAKAKEFEYEPFPEETQKVRITTTVALHGTRT